MQQYINSTIQGKPYCCHLNLVQRDYSYDVLTAHLQRTCTLNDLLPSSPITFTDNFPFPASFRSGYFSKVSQYTISTQITNFWNIFLDCNCSVNSIFPILCHCVSIGAVVNPQQEMILHSNTFSISPHKFFLHLHHWRHLMTIANDRFCKLQYVQMIWNHKNNGSMNMCVRPTCSWLQSMSTSEVTTAWSGGRTKNPSPRGPPPRAINA